MPLIPPLTVALPLAGAALLAIVGGRLPHRWTNAAALATPAATTGLQFAQLLQAWPHPLLHWFGGWTPQHHFALGVDFAVDPLDAGLACVAGVLMVAALGFAWLAVREVSHLFQVMMLAFLAGMSGFAVSGDLFDIFVFFELMSVAGYALCSFRNTSPSVVQGSLNFAIINTVGALCILMGIALIYGRTGALNLAQIATALHGHRPDALVVVSFVLISVGFLVKAGSVPFHFWLSDAYAVAAAPVGALYAGIMSELGLHAVAKVYAHAFAGDLAGTHLPAVRNMFVALGVVTALVGALMCYGQADTKRQLAFLVVSQGGIFLCGVGLMTPAGLAGSTLYVAADGMAKGALFLIIGYCVGSIGASDELWLRGRGRTRSHAAAGVGFALSGLALAALPGFGTWLSAAMIARSADASGYGWLPPVLVAATAVTGGTVLRAAGRIFLGWGPQRDPLLTSEPDEPSEGEPPEGGLRRWVLLPPAVLLLIGYGLAFAPQLPGYALHSAASFLDLPGYVAEVLSGRVAPAPGRLPGFTPGSGSWAYGAASTAGALLVAAASLFAHRLPRPARRGLRRVAVAPLAALKSVHTGRVGDFATWLAVGLAALFAAGAATLR